MEIITYEIQKGDTLQSIAEKHDITVKELVYFHNQNCGITQQIIDENIPFHINYLFINLANSNSFKPIESLVLEFNDFNELYYQSNHITEIYINGGELSKYSQFQKFKLDFNSTNHTFNLNVYDNNIGDNLELLEKFDGLIEKIVRLKDNLLIAVDSRGEIMEVLNKIDLRNKWSELKSGFIENEILKEVPKQNLEEMLSKGDLEFSDNYPLAEELKKSVFHSHLFFPFYNQEFKTDFTNSLKDSGVVSSLFPNTIIPLKSILLLIDNEHDNEYIFKIESQIDKSKLDYSKLEKLYHNNYPFLKDNFVKYSLDITRFYAINKKTLQINFVDVEIEEVVNNNLEAYQKLEIEKINNNES